MDYKVKLQIDRRRGSTQDYVGREMRLQLFQKQVTGTGGRSGKI